MRQMTFVRAEDTNPSWRHIDADGQRLGRMAMEIATVLMGKHRPDWTPHVDCGDFVVVTNAEKVVLTGKKAQHMLKYSYSGYPGGIKARTYEELLKTRPEHVIEDAVQGMLPKGRLGRAMLRKLKVYKGGEHPHQAQQPVPLMSYAK